MKIELLRSTNFEKSLKKVGDVIEVSDVIGKSMIDRGIAKEQAKEQATRGRPAKEEVAQ